MSHGATNQLYASASLCCWIFAIRVKNVIDDYAYSFQNMKIVVVVVIIDALNFIISTKVPYKKNAISVVLRDHNVANPFKFMISSY